MGKELTGTLRSRRFTGIEKFIAIIFDITRIFLSVKRDFIVQLI